MQMVEIVSAIAQILVATTALVVSTSVALFVHRGTKQAADIEYWRSVRDAWIQIDTIALSNDATLKVADTLFNPELSDQSIEDIRKRWFGYMALNVSVSQYFGTSFPEEVEEPLRRERAKVQLEKLIKDDVVYHLTQSGIYRSDFESICRSLRHNQGLPTD